MSFCMYVLISAIMECLFAFTREEERKRRRREGRRERKKRRRNKSGEREGKRVDTTAFVTKCWAVAIPEAALAVHQGEVTVSGNNTIIYLFIKSLLSIKYKHAARFARCVPPSCCFMRVFVSPILHVSICHNLCKHDYGVLVFYLVPGR